LLLLLLFAGHSVFEPPSSFRRWSEPEAFELEDP